MIKTAYTINHAITFTQNSNNSILIETDWFSLNKNGKSFDININNLVKSLIHLEKNSDITLKYNNISFKFMEYLNNTNLKVLSKYFHRLQNISKKPNLISSISGVLPESGIITTHILPNIVNNELRFYIVGFDLYINNSLIVGLNLMSTMFGNYKTEPLFTKKFGIMKNINEIISNYNYVLTRPSFTIVSKNKTKDYEYNLNLFKKLYNNKQKLYYVDNFKTYNIIDISLISNPQKGYSLLIECEKDNNFIIQEYEIYQKIFKRD